MSITRSSNCVIFLLALVLVAGCKSGVERDVVEREMRRQEDQIYALEDYLSEYQQLLCNARSENAQLRRQLVQEQYREGTPPQQSGQSESLPAPGSAAPEQPPGTTPANERSVIPPEVPSLDMTDPEVPALDDQSAYDPEEVASEVEPASAEIEVVHAPPSAVVLRGEVHLDDASGPRVLLEVEPVGDDGQSTDFHGRLSLLVLDPSAREKEQRLARWDFTAADLEPMASSNAKGTTFEFPLQLPVDAPLNRPLELWVRLEPEEGEKLLGRTTMDLGRPGRFASAEVRPETTSTKKQHPVRTASAEVSILSMPKENSRLAESGFQSSDWHTARPGEEPKSTAAKSNSEWKTATLPVPEVESTPVISRDAERYGTTPPATLDRYEVAAAPEWSPERPAGSDRQSPPAPDWSPTR